MQNTHPERDTADTEVEDLLERRAKIQEWLARLDQQAGKVSERILSRVREDYSSRLQAAMNALAAHRRAIEDQAAGAASRLESAVARRADAIEELEEAQLRTVIGEIADEDWADEEPRLKDAVRDATESEARAREETERLTGILAQLDRSEETAAVNPEPRTLDADEPDAEDLEDAVNIDDDATVEVFRNTFATVEGDEDEDLADAEAFLSEIDRALATAPDQATSSNGAGEEDTSPKPGVKCGECGYTNDINAWFCGVCGADVG